MPLGWLREGIANDNHRSTGERSNRPRSAGVSKKHIECRKITLSGTDTYDVLLERGVRSAGRREEGAGGLGRCRGKPSLDRATPEAIGGQAER